MSERTKQNGLSVFITAVGLGLLFFCRHDALTSGEYSLKLLFFGAVMLVWGPMSFALNLRDPMTTQRAITRLTSKSPDAKQSIAMTLAVLVVGMVIAAGVDYVFGLWIGRDLAACRASNTCTGTGGSPKSVL